MGLITAITTLVLRNVTGVVKRKADLYRKGKGMEIELSPLTF